MFVIVCYDIHAKRVQKALKICRKYLRPVQRSVFEGMITEAKLKKLSDEFYHLIDPHYDSVRIYLIQSLKYTSKQEIGVKALGGNIL
ncbi:MAG: CRISPR-associated endonuclease Cas2 [Christensenellales bacterium]|jgi:CRISPR-associated protein Cas2